MIRTEALAPLNSRFPLAGSSFSSELDQPSQPGVRPWGLRRAVPARRGRSMPAWRYDDVRQLAVTASGCPLIEAVDGDPSADTTSTTDGEDGPSSEDWDND